MRTRSAHLNMPRLISILGLTLLPFSAVGANQGGSKAGRLSLPQHVHSVTVSLGVELIGYDVMGPSLSRGTASEVVRGQVYTFEFYWRILEPLGRFDCEVALLLGDMPIALVPLLFEDVQIGSVHRASVTTRIPTTGATGEVQLHIRPNMLKGAGDIGLLLVRERDVPIEGRPNGNPPPVAGNLIQNGSFEQGVGPWVIYEPWPSGASLYLEKEVAYDGVASVRLDFSGASNPSVWRILSQSVVAKSSTVYELSYYLKTEHINTPCGVKLEVVDRDQMQRFIVGVDEYLTGSQMWTPMTYRFTTPEFTRGLTVRVRRYACGLTYGSAWFDRVTLTEVQ
jgi:hypothetical protein